MNCPMLTGKYMLSCTALKEVYVPSVFELQEYCKKSLHTMCPLYMKNDAQPNTVPLRSSHAYQKR